MAGRPAAARTALGPMMIAAIEQYQPSGQRLVVDDLAYRFLPPAARLAVRVCRPRGPRDLFVSFSEKQAAGVWASIACRKRYADDKVREAIENGAEAIVILGAGLDTRGRRFGVRNEVPVFEVDLPANVAGKQAKLAGTRGVALVPVDFDTDDLGRKLAAHGFDPGQKTIFVWEAVTQYLTADGVRRTMDFLSGAAAGSGLVFTYIPQDFIDGTRLYGAENLYRRFRGKDPLWRFGIAPGKVAEMLAEYGWREVEQLGRDEFLARYVTPTGRGLAVSDLERSVYADKT
jgi:methyltransferase (TIGR00027 family)